MMTVATPFSAAEPPFFNAGFSRYIGIDYSGAATAGSRLPGLQVFEQSPAEGLPRPVAAPEGRHWSRASIAAWLAGLLEAREPFIAGLDHGFSFPLSWFRAHQLPDWPAFLADFTTHWPCHLPEISVEALRPAAYPAQPRPPGASHELRLTEAWTAGAKSVFLFDVQGSVAKSTFAGLPWLQYLRQRGGDFLHIWPFDGWQPAPGKAVLVEAYPSLYRRRYPAPSGLGPDARDAWATARWLADMDQRGLLPRYFHPPLTSTEAAQARMEGWILGVG